MAYLLDTSILVRLANKADAAHPVAARAVERLLQHGETLCICPQNLTEFRSCATRPVSANGLGLSPKTEEAVADGFEAVFELLPETFELFIAWKMVVRTYGIIGKQVHDARLAALCQVHEVSHLLTFNGQHFNRFATVGQGLSVIDPSAVS